MRTHRAGHDGARIDPYVAMMRPAVIRPTRSDRFVRAYMRGFSFVFVGVALYAAWLHAGTALAAAILSALATWVWSNSPRSR